MSSLNATVPERIPPSTEPEVLIELPVPKPIAEDCNIIMNGHHNFATSKTACNGILVEVDDTVFGSENIPPSNSKSESMDSSLLSPGGVPLKESPAPSSPEESEAELESSTHLLQDESHESQNKCLRSKPRLPSFKSSPSRKTLSGDSHSHIQHRPLGIPHSGSPPHFVFFKWKWRLVHFACVGFVVALIVGLICVVVGLIVYAPPDCDVRRQWWQGSVAYEIFPASFQDTDGDGFGDIRGIIERLDYVQNLSFSVIRLNSIFSALDYPLEYEHVIDFANIDPHLGRMEDFEELVREVHGRDMFIILDMNPTVTSDQHSWAAHWLLHRPGRYEHFYINTTNEEDDPPLETNPTYTDDDWPPPHRTFGSHFFLNWSNPLLLLEMRTVIDFWLSIGVDGFYMKHLENMFINDQSHYLAIVHQWRHILDRHSENSTKRVLMMSQGTMEYLKSAMDTRSFAVVSGMVDLVDSSIKMDKNSSGTDIGEDVESTRKFWESFPDPPMVMWHLGSVETMRISSRIGREINLAGFHLMGILPGSFSVFYGDEIGIQNSFEEETKKIYRGGHLGPMPWNAGPQANFTFEDSTPWIPVHPDYVTLNVDFQQEKLNTLKRLIELKNEEKIFPPEDKHSLVHSLVTRLSGSPSGELHYQWYYNHCGLLVAKSFGIFTEYMYIGNFGTEALSFSIEEECAGGNFVFSLYPWNHVEVILSTNPALNGKVELHQLLLEPGDSVIGKLVT